MQTEVIGIEERMIQDKLWPFVGDWSTTLEHGGLIGRYTLAGVFCSAANKDLMNLITWMMSAPN